MKRNLKIKLIILFAVTFFFCHSVSVFASVLELKTEKNSLEQNEIFTLDIILNTEGKQINAVEGDIKYDSSFLKIENINTGNSFISFWIEKPEVKNDNLIHFSGITPGGVSLLNGEVFRIVFRAINSGEVNFLLENINLYLNDGIGSIDSSKLKNLKLNIEKNTNNTSPVFEIVDTSLPEPFNITRTKDKSIYDDKYFIVFNTIDKGSSIDYYKVCEFFSCSKVEDGPLLLKNQSPFYYITVSAYDYNENLRLSYLISPWIFVILGIFVVFIIFSFFYRRYLKFNKI